MSRVLIRRDPAWPDRGTDALREDLGPPGEAVAAIEPVVLFELEGVDRADADRAGRELLAHPLVETAEVIEAPLEAGPGERIVTVVRRPGVMDPVVGSTREALRTFDIEASGIRIARAWLLHLTDGADGTRADEAAAALASRLANPVIERVIRGRVDLPARREPARASAERVTIPLARLPAENETRGLHLTPPELEAVADHFRDLGRDPTDLELETVAQTWSEHCKHKTLNGPVRLGDRSWDRLLAETVFRATEELDADHCVSVFSDNAGVIALTDEVGLAVKVETHNHPSAIEPYGGAETGVGGVIRDILGTGLGARPVLDIDVFGFPPPDLGSEEVPAGALPPLRIIRGVVRGVSDYGNRMGIPTASGTCVFDRRYGANPVVYCGTVGLIPLDRVEKAARPGDVICLVGGRTGRDGIHGATFSSAHLDAESEVESAGAVQIGNAIEEKKVLEGLLRARDEELYTAVTDCGAGGLSSAVGEMAAGRVGPGGEARGAVCHLDRVPLKYEGLRYDEIWISEAQERMVLAVPPDRLDRLVEVLGEEGVEATDIGRFTDDGDLVCLLDGEEVGRLDLTFLHDGLPREEKVAVEPPDPPPPPGLPDAVEPGRVLRRILEDWDVCSRAPIFRQYDHEVQGASVLKPYAGPGAGPTDGCVVAPLPDEPVGFACGLGIAPRLADLDARRATLAVVDEAIRNAVACGGDPDHAALLDNFTWGNPDRPEVLGSLVRAARGCREAALGYGVPFVSGKDSLHNEHVTDEGAIAVPPTLLITCVARVPDVERVVSPALAGTDDRILLVGRTGAELGGSLLHRVLDLETGGPVPAVDPAAARTLYRTVHAAIREGLVTACHDPSEGGLAVALAEMTFGAGRGVRASLAGVPTAGELDPVVTLFAETPGRLLVACRPDDEARLVEMLGEAGVVHGRLGTVSVDGTLRVADADGEVLLDETVDELRETWRTPFRSVFGPRPAGT